MQKTQRLHLPDGSREHTFLVYDANSGEIVHGHTEILLPGVEPPGSDVLSRRALQHAAKAIDRDVSTLHALAVDPAELKPGTHYRVDVATRCLHPATSK